MTITAHQIKAATAAFAWKRSIFPSDFSPFLFISIVGSKKVIADSVNAIHIKIIMNLVHALHFDAILIIESTSTEKAKT
ncbi:hypothetical protein EUGRSUZ_L00279 [Eucalyptus grandis]|uniref:Uncharacterized protein n=2 Tax=Eucalyptus grandis TaxID=71139 RepID=A0ACC3LCI0_EUCGR|nr:hypothetical protein EUGRSUZ_L00279 [Eucalyptus grandis]